MGVFDEPGEPIHRRKLRGQTGDRSPPRVAHVFDDQSNKIGGLLTRTIGLNRSQTSTALA